MQTTTKTAISKPFRNIAHLLNENVEFTRNEPDEAIKNLVILLNSNIQLSDNKKECK
jgi:hypothetical protein